MRRRTFTHLILALALSALCLIPVKATVLWDGDASLGTGVFKTLNIEDPDGNPGTGTVTAVTDATYGTVWKFYKPAGDHRCEAHAAQGFQASEGSTIYIGWRFKLSMPQALTTNAVFQWKAYGSNMLQNYPIVLKTINGNLTLMQYDPDGSGGKIAHTLWSQPVVINRWMDVVLKIKVSKTITTGQISFWFDGAAQTLSNGSATFTCRTLDADYCDPKWGSYGGDASAVTNYVDAMKIASTYAEAAPAAPASSNIALNKTVTASSTWSASYPASNAVDGSASTRWASASGVTAATLEVDLGGTYSVNRTITKEYSSRVSSYKIQYWTGSAWANAYTGTTIGSAKTDNFTSVTTSKVRLNILNCTTAAPSIYEFEVYGYAKSASLTTNKVPASVSMDVYPNPVSDNSVIDYSLSEAAGVKISIYNLNGVQVENVLDAYQTAGEYKIKPDFFNLKPGIYIIKMQTGNTVKAIKIMR